MNTNQHYRSALDALIEARSQLIFTAGLYLEMNWLRAMNILQIDIQAIEETAAELAGELYEQEMSALGKREPQGSVPQYAPRCQKSHINQGVMPPPKTVDS